MECTELDRSPGGAANGIHRKVSFREDDLCTACRRERHLATGGQNGGPAPLTPVLSGGRRGFYPPVERAVVRTFSIDKMRPVCPVCNPGGDTPYPTGFPQRCCDEGAPHAGQPANGGAPHAGQPANGDARTVRKNLIETAADIVLHKWDGGDGKVSDND
jgi:hypothetical protein